MQTTFTSRRAAVLLILAALPFMLGGGCVVVWSTGTSHDDKCDRECDREEEQNRVVTSGSFSEPEVVGLRFVSGSIVGITGNGGSFEFEPGDTVQFSIGDIVLGEPVPAKTAMSTRDLIAVNNDKSETMEVNIRRLLKSLDDDPESRVITLPGELHATAVRSNETISAAIEFLDFSDDTAFANAGSQLVSVLTQDYPFTATLIDAQELPPRSVER